MIRVLVVADSGPVLEGVTARLWHIDAVEIVGYASGASNVGAIVTSTLPDVVLVDEMRWPGLALKRIAEIRRAAPHAVVVGLCESADEAWVIDGLRAGASVVVPRRLDAPMLAGVLQDALHASSTTSRSAA